LKKEWEELKSVFMHTRRATPHQICNSSGFLQLFRVLSKNLVVSQAPSQLKEDISTGPAVD
jgi:hypothetical protein